MPSLKCCCARISQKWVFAIMGFFAIYCGHAMRMSLSFTIPQMVRTIEDSKELIDMTCPVEAVNLSSKFNSSQIVQNGTFDWDEYEQGIILGSFYWGYIVSHVPGGIIAERYGGKHTVGLGILLTGIFTMAIPVAVNWGGSTILVILRLLQGMTEGVTQPGMSVMLSHWVPAEERARMTSIVFVGSIFGVLSLSMGLGPTLRALGWPGIYYLFGGSGILWFVLWCGLCYNTPREHPFISEKEARELAEKLGQHTHEKPPPVPWKQLLRSGPFLGLVMGTIGRDWTGYTLVTDLPKYLISVLKFSIDETSYLFIIMMSVHLACSMLFSELADWLIEKKYLSRTCCRKVMTTISLGLTTVFFIVIAYSNCDKVFNSIVLVLCYIFMSAGFPGIKANVFDLSPNYSGTVMAVSHGIAGFCGMAGPYVVGVLAPNQTLKEWRKVFWIIALVNIVTNIFFNFYASGEVQYWNDPNFRSRRKKYDFGDEMRVSKPLVKENAAQKNETIKSVT